MNNLLQRINQVIGARNLLRAEARVLVAVSGGVDSVVLLMVLQQLAATHGWQLVVAHYNHQLRGAASAGDERFVKALARTLKLSFVAGRGRVKQLAKRQGISLEMAARMLRHKFLAEAAVKMKCPVIATAHHADDQVELFFLRLLRGAGGAGLAGMKWSSPSPACAKVRMIRPLLEVTKRELEEFARLNKILFREDATNESRDILRNRVRHELLPLLRREFQPGLDRTVLRLMDLVGAEAAVVAGLAQNWLDKVPHRTAWRELAVAVQRRVIQLQLQRLRVTSDFELVERLRLQPGKSVSAAEHQRVVCKPNGQVRMVPTARPAFATTEQKLNLLTCKRVSFGGLEVTWSFAKAKEFVRPKNESGCEFFDAGQVGATVILRFWRPGDRFQPIGMKTAVKLQDWFTNQKIPATRRRKLVLATTISGEIFWIEGLRIGERFKLTPATRRVLNWRWPVR